MLVFLKGIFCSFIFSPSQFYHFPSFITVAEGLVFSSPGVGMLTGTIMDCHNQKGYFLYHFVFACSTLISCIPLVPEINNYLPETLSDGETYRVKKSGELLDHYKRKKLTPGCVRRSEKEPQLQCPP